MRYLPEPRLLPTGAVPTLKWGLVGAGWVAGRFARAIRLHTTQTIAAVAARDPRRTARFAEAFGIPLVYDSVEGLVADEAIDVVYVATPHSLHREQALAAIAAAKHVLVEKPLARDAAEAAEVTEAARVAGVLAMEAMWTRYLPQMDILSQLLAEGDLGKIHQVTADHGVVSPYDPTGRMWDPHLGGGALLDLGIYPVWFASAVLGSPAHIHAVGSTTPDGIDLRATGLLTYASGAEAIVSTSMLAKSPHRAGIVGALARVDLPSSFLKPTGIIVTERVRGVDVVRSWTDTTFLEPYDALSYQATALASYVDEGLLESPIHPHAEIVDVLATIDAIRGQLTVIERIGDDRTAR